MAVHYLQAVDPQRWLQPRPQETRLGQAVATLSAEALRDGESYADALQAAYQAGQRVALIGIPESIGVKGNLGRPGAELAWSALLPALLNLQATPHIGANELLLVGSVDCDDLQQQADSLDVKQAHQLQRVRELCEMLDQRVTQIVTPLFAAGFDVIAVGGGHNNALPLLRSLAQASASPCGAVNLDPHADFRPREGRHSGNGFSYAYVEGALQQYHVMGLHEGKNSALSLKQLADAQMRYHSIHRLYDMTFTEALTDVAAKAESWQLPLAIEVDVDAIQHAPASAINHVGVTVAQAYRYVSQLAELSHSRYLHLAEAAPGLHPAGLAEGQRAVGQLLSELIIAYLRGRNRRA
ncbi:formimidoylglutamase [Idiomarina xiamenensis]|uniref:Arginase/agmatinase/formiminoglutamase n=1 Tax=Idiomarina xiamenensis 10-D-4 TaxID=740709 RepID=K2KDV2_9GAMM|nr:formimidoylglutamase [Idiomarina xiamenensis]EKE80899.1 arginase/agmatinase/formiminoglutamase [Idiomarina xiamenensis 10-D-4]